MSNLSKTNLLKDARRIVAHAPRRAAGVLGLCGGLLWPCLLTVEAQPVTPAGQTPEPPLFHVVPNRSTTGATTTGDASTPGAPPAAAALNILILALDESDINAARFMNLTPAGAAPNAAVGGALDVPLPDAPDAPPARPGGRVFRLPKTAPANPNPNAPAPMPRLNLAPGGAAAPDAKGINPAIAPASMPRTLPPAVWRVLAQQNDMLARADNPNRAPSGAAASGRSIPALPSLPKLDDSSLDLPSRRAPGRAQTMAAPLRRALAGAGFRDVLSTPLDGPSVLRSMNSGRLSIRVADTLRFATGQMLDAAKAGAGRFSAQPGVIEDAPPAPALAQARQAAIASATRIGLTMGYRAVLVLAVASDAEKTGAVYSLLLVDAPRETGEAFLLHQAGTNEIAVDQNAANSAAQNLASQLRTWPAFSNSDRAAQVEKHMASARAALQKGDLPTAQDQLNLVVAFDASNSEAYVLLGDALQGSDPPAAAKAYQRAAEINTKSGEVWAKIAMTHTMSSPPDWVRTLQSASRALQLGYDSANLRTAMAAAEFGRAELFRRSGRVDQAEDTELVARQHLDRARELAPDNPEVSASVSRLMAKYLLEQKRYKEAVQSLELLAIQYPNDLQTQTMYARALEGYGKRDEDTFLAWSKVWRIGGESEVPLEAGRYAVIADGFDQRAVNILKNIFQMTYGVSTGAILRETALLQTDRAKNDLQAAITALQLMRPPAGRTTSEAHVNRLFAADLMSQALEYYSIYLETGNDLNRTRAVDMHRQAIESLNLARGGSATGTGA
jgi:tetratricopeptide (TPR) repeat protein